MANVKGSIYRRFAEPQKPARTKDMIPEVGSKRFHRPRLSKADLLYSHSRRKTKSLISMLLGYSLRLERLSAPRTNVKLRALTPTGRPAVKIRLG